MNVLLDYVFNVTAITPTTEASTSFLKKVCAVVAPNGAEKGTPTLCSTTAEIDALTDNTDCDALLSAGMSSIYVLPMDDLDLATALDGYENTFYTVLISSDFDDTDIASLDIGNFPGVVGLNTDTKATAATYAATEKQVGFYSLSANKAENMFYAFGKMLSNALNWRNQQYITMPKDDEIETIGDAEDLYDDKVSFVITDTQYGSRLALFAVGAKAIIAPYVVRNLEIDMQSAALSYISGNQPAYTKKEAALLENVLKDVILQYISDEWIENGTVEVALEASNFIASCNINIAEPNALWRVLAELQQTL